MSLSGGGRGVHTPVPPIDRSAPLVASHIKTYTLPADELAKYRAMKPPVGKPPVMMDFDIELAKKRMPRTSR